MNLASLLANKCFEFLLSCDGEKDRRSFIFSVRESRQPSSAAHLLSPPWALAARAFKDKCDGCGSCLDLCPHKILIPDGNGYPVVDFRRGSCDFCGACAASCTRGAFRSLQSRPPWRIMARIGDTCLARNNVLCRSCTEHCPEGAIIFPRQSGSLGAPSILPERCTGCGACVGPCPAQAIAVDEEVETYESGGSG